MLSNKNANNNQLAFTIIELLVVIGIIALLATMAIVATNYARSYAKRTKAQADLKTISKAMENLALDTRQWPGHQAPYVVCQTNCNDNEMEDLMLPLAGLKETDGLFTNWNGPYMQILTVDPWGNEYFFDSDYETGGETKAALGSYGPNGQGLNLYDQDDIIYVVSY